MEKKREPGYSKLTKKQWEMLAVLNEHGLVTTDPPSHQHNTMLALVRKGWATQGERFKNMFRPVSITVNSQPPRV